MAGIPLQPSRQQYERQLRARLAEAQARGLRPGYYEIPVWHDAWCELLAGRGSCNCSRDCAKRRQQEQVAALAESRRY
jgi:hypothetical protein